MSMSRHQLVGLALALLWVVASSAPLAAQDEATLEILCNPDGATVYVDGQEVATTPMIEPVPVLAGDHLIRVDRPGFIAFEEPMSFMDGDEIFLEVELLPFAGIVRIVTAEPGATVLLDGQAAGTTPYEDEVTLGEHTFTVRRARYEDWTQTAVINAGEEYFFEATLVAVPDSGPEVVITDTTPFYQEWWFWTGAALLIGGGVATAVLLSEDEEATPVDILIELP
jgi:hypothetical protein